MPSIACHSFFYHSEDPGHRCIRATHRLRLQPWGVLFFLLVLLGGAQARAEIYSIQAGIFKNLKNAQLQYNSIFNALPDIHRSGLRIDKSGTLYAVRIGRFETQSQAEALLPLIKSVSTEAFIRKGDFMAQDTLLAAARPPASPPAPSAKTKPPDPGLSKMEEKPSWKVVKPIPPEEGSPPPAPAPQDQPPSLKRSDQPPGISPDPKKSGLRRNIDEPPPRQAPKGPPSETGKPSAKKIEPSARGTPPPASGTSRMEPSESPQADPAIPANRAWLQGSIREFSPLSSGQLGLKPPKEIFRLILQVEDTKEVAGYANLLAEKEGDLLTVFSDKILPFFKIGNRINALIEYRGSRYSRFFWIVKAEVLSQ